MTGERRHSSFWLLSLALLLLVGAGYGTRVLLIQLAERSILAHQAEIDAARACLRFEPPGPMTPRPWGGDNVWDLLHPAFDGLEKLREIYDKLDDHEELPSFRKLSLEDFSLALTEVHPDLDACRKALERSDPQWRGEPDPHLPSKALLTGRILSLKAYRDWQQGRDRDAIEGVFTALRIAQISTRVSQSWPRQSQEYQPPGCFDILLSIESWACEAARYILSSHRLSAAQLEDVERRLDGLRAQRPSPISALPFWSAQGRGFALEPNFTMKVIVAKGLAARQTLGESLGPRDLYDMRIRTSRILGRIHRSATHAARYDWNSSAALEPLWEDRCRGLTEDNIDQVWTLTHSFESVYRALLRWDLFRVALGVARYEAANDRMPLTLDKAGVGDLLGRPVTIREHTFFVPLYLPGSLSVMDDTAQNDLEWTIHRR